MITDFKALQATGSAGAKVVNIRCPVCNHIGAFHGAGEIKDFLWVQKGANDEKPDVAANIIAGVRLCPNVVCRAVVFIVAREQGLLLKSYPPQVIDFDATNLPQEIKESLTEAIRCHSAECFKASALMVRRTLEELCEDKNATGNDLKERLQNLGQNIVVPKELIDAADELRLLGNDAAHVHAKNYDAIGPVEATLAIELTKELLKATYQYGSLVSKLKALKKTP